MIGRVPFITLDLQSISNQLALFRNTEKSWPSKAEELKKICGFFAQSCLASHRLLCSKAFRLILIASFLNTIVVCLFFEI